MLKISKKQIDKKKIGLDFDGVLHSYKNGWTGAMPKEEPIEGAQEFVRELKKRGFELFIVSARAKSKEGKEGIKKWLEEHNFPKMEVTREKHSALLYIDDRGYRFDGKFEKALDFINSDKIKPWYE